MIFVFDLDGTICFKGQMIDNEICRAIETCIAQGHEVIFASARPIRDMLPVIPTKFHSFRMVGGNGAFTLQAGEVKVTSFSEETAASLLQLIEQHQLAYLIDSDWDYSYTGSKSHPIFQNLDRDNRAVNRQVSELKQICKVVLFDVKQDLVEQILELPVTVFQHHNENLIDISPQQVNKMQGLQSLGVNKRDFIAFGNDQNDIELFHYAQYSVCVGSHHAGSYANRIIEQLEVANTIRELIMNIPSQ